jgi:membrane protein DedA with SNARE-associated domain
MSRLLIDLVSNGGLIAIFVLMALESAGLPISSEIVVPLGGALAAAGKLTLVVGPDPAAELIAVVVVCSLANLTGSLVAYGLTRRYGEAFVLGPGRRLGLHAGHLRLAERVFDRWGMAAVFFGRLLPIVRTYISFPAGVSRITVVPFTVLTLLGAIPWNFALAYAGLKLGQNWDHVGKVMGPFTIPIAVVVLVLLGIAWYYGQRITEDGVLEARAPAGK